MKAGPGWCPDRLLSKRDRYELRFINMQRIDILLLIRSVPLNRIPRAAGSALVLDLLIYTFLLERVCDAPSLVNVPC
jgi:hypothetical protein